MAKGIADARTVNSVLPTEQGGIPGANVLLLDNYDSFTWNLYQYLCLLGASVTVVRSQSCTLDELTSAHPAVTHLVVSPGPGHPLRDSGISIPTIQHYAGRVPVLGVCMGLQCMYAAYGGVVDGAGEIVHGKTSVVKHDGKGLFKGVAQDIQSTRYHSLAARIGSLPVDMEVTSRTAAADGGEGIVMGIRHRVHAMEAVQYHPESILSEQGKDLLANFLRLRGGTWADNPGYGVKPSDSSTTASATRSMPSTSSALPTILQKICTQRILDVAQAKAVPGAESADLAAKIALHVAPLQIDFHQRLLRQGSAVGEDSRVALMAEIKRASPSKGSFVTASTPSPPQIALSYAIAGASTISVLTEPTWFKGTLQDMLSVRLALDAVPNRPAVLRKDFILDPYQIDEARCYGADTVLLIVACLDDELLKRLYDHSLSLGMEPLVEVNNPAELERALGIGAKVIGVNNRNLHDFSVDMGTTSRLADAIRERNGRAASPSEQIVLCALSGISSRADVEGYVKEGVSAVLVGEALMKATDKGAFVRQLLGTDRIPHLSTTVQVGPPDGLANGTRPFKGDDDAPEPTLVKICGIKSVEAANAAADAGADLLGFIFAPRSKRYISFDQAAEIAGSIRSRPPRPRGNDETLPSSGDWFAFQAARVRSLARRRSGRPLLVGVFQNAPLETILQAVDTVPLDLVQLHGTEPLDWCRLISVPVIKVFHVSDDETESNEALREATRPGYHALALLDTKVSAAKGALSGGAGKTFDWAIARKVADRTVAVAAGTAAGRLPVLLAGGLNESNISEAVSAVRPWAVDVSGGVETDGQKDFDKIRRFMAVARPP